MPFCFPWGREKGCTCINSGGSWLEDTNEHKRVIKGAVVWSRIKGRDQSREVWAFEMGWYLLDRMSEKGKWRSEVC